MATTTASSVRATPERAWLGISAAVVSAVYALLAIVAGVDHVTGGTASRESSLGVALLAYIPAMPLVFVVDSVLMERPDNLAWHISLCWTIAIGQWSLLPATVLRLVRRKGEQVAF